MAPSPPRSTAIVTTQLSVMMFLEFFVWGAWYVTVGNYMAAHGMAGGIANAYTVGPLAAIISPFFLGMIADRFFATERVLAVMHLLGAAALFCATLVPHDKPWTEDVFVLALLAHMLCYMPTLGLTNTLAFHNITKSEKQFPLIRVFGTIGWIVAGWAVALVNAHVPLEGIDLNNVEAVKAARAGLPHFFYIGAAAGALLGLISFTLPHTPPPAAGRRGGATVRDVLGLESISLLRDPSFAVFIACSFLICIPLAAYYAFAPVFAGAVGYDPAKEVPQIMSYGQVSEIFFMLVMPLMFARLGVKWMLLVGMLAWVTRYGLFAGAWDGAGQHVQWMVLAGIILHGICYDFFFVTGQVYVDKKARPEIRGQAQGFLVLVTQGLGLGIGAQVVGRIVGHYTTKATGAPDIVRWQSIWLIPCLAAAAIAVIFFLLFHDRAPKPTPSQPQD